MACLCLAYFYLINGRILNFTDVDVYHISKHTAKSTNKDLAIKYLEKLLAEKTKKNN